MTWIPIKIQPFPKDKIILVSTYESVYLIANKKLFLIMGPSQVISEIDFIAWMLFPEPFTKEDELVSDMNNEMVQSMIDSFKKDMYEHK